MRTDEQLSAAQLAALVAALGRAVPADDPAEAIDRIRLLEEIKSAAAAAQARQTAVFDATRRAEQKEAGVPAARMGQGIAGEVGLARRCSPFHAARYVRWARILTEELPATLDALSAGRTTEWRAMIVARETAWLSRGHRAEVDRTIAPRLADLGDRAVESEAKKLAYRLDPQGVVNRQRNAPSERRVSLRPAPDTMTWLTALLPVAQGVAVYAALKNAADTTTAVGDPRSRGQVMADTLVERITGQATADQVPVTVNLVMRDGTLLAAGPDAHEPATLEEYGPIPADIARDLLCRPGADEHAVWIRRLYANPDSGQLVSMETRARLFTPAQRGFIRLRDQSCRTPYCGAPIRHADHVIAAADGGPTTLSNAQALCEACNYAKQAPGWSATTSGGDVITTTPTGHRYRSRAPAPPGRPRDPGRTRRVRRSSDPGLPRSWP